MSIRPGIGQSIGGPSLDEPFDPYRDDPPSTCRDCGKERVLNERGYCDECWTDAPYHEDPDRDYETAREVRDELPF